MQPNDEASLTLQKAVDMQALDVHVAEQCKHEPVSCTSAYFLVVMAPNSNMCANLHLFNAGARAVLRVRAAGGRLL